MSAATATPSSARPFPLSPGAVVGIAVVVGLIIRLICVQVAVKNAYPWDHLDFMSWAQYAEREGPWALYKPESKAPILRSMPNPQTGELIAVPWAAPHACNYPPLSCYVFWAQGKLWRMLAAEQTAALSRFDPRLAQQLGMKRSETVRSRLTDTYAARFVNVAPGIVFDFLLAVGVAGIVATLRRTRFDLIAAIAFAATFLAPPVFLDSAFWGQADSWIAAFMVWTLLLMLREQWILAGIVFGAALLVKPQAILMGPVFVFIAIALPLRHGDWKRMLRIVPMALAAIVTLLVLAAPFSLANDDDDTARGASAVMKPWASDWFKASYSEQIFSKTYQRTTLSAFNFWWFDFLSNSKNPAGQKSDSKWLGVQKNTIGTILLGMAIIAAWVVGWRRGFTRDTWVIVAYLVLLAAFVWPTHVHERYIFYCIPFLIPLAFRNWLWLIPLAALMIVGSAEMTHPSWLDQRNPSAVSRGLAALSVAAFLSSLAIPFIPVGDWGRRDAEPAPEPRTGG